MYLYEYFDEVNNVGETFTFVGKFYMDIEKKKNPQESWIWKISYGNCSGEH